MAILQGTAGAAPKAAGALGRPQSDAAQGPSLPVTLGFIRDKLGSLGRIDYIDTSHSLETGKDTTFRYSTEISQVQISEADCRVSYHWRFVSNGTVTTDNDLAFRLQEVQDILVQPYADYMKEMQGTGGGKVVATRSSEPALVVLKLRGTHGKGALPHLFILQDPTLADRLARALTHGVELCGGGNKEPF